MRASVRRLLCAAVLLPALLVTVASAGFAGWRCHRMGLGLTTVHASRCCPGAGPTLDEMSQGAGGANRSEAGDGDAHVAGQRCCEVTQVRAVRVPSELSRAETLLVPPDASDCPSWAHAPSGAGATVLSEVAPRPGGGLPGTRAVLLRKQSFLI